MILVTETVLDAAAEALGESAEAFNDAVVELEEQQPEVLGYFFAEHFEAFTQEEREYAFYLLLVIWKAITMVVPELPTVDAEALEEAEERNWTLLQDVQTHNWHDRLDVFFQDSPQEDLLAFIEDGLTIDEEEEEPVVTKEGREALFVALKSVIDCWGR
ncbi:MAG: hypothetical protein JNK77_15310 [Saprospiraceae bacterium]|nr:hypothetical protein [Saprospiraceae bacterium]